MAANEAKTTAEVKPPKQGRSPAYPGIDLESALDKVKELYNAEGKYAVPMSSAFKAWGFSEKSSGGRELRAALRYFGLIVIEGEGDSGKIKVSEDALRILLDDRQDQTEKQSIIRRLALNPPIHKKLLEKFPDGIKSDGTVEHFLVWEEHYNKPAAVELVAEFKATATFAGLFQPLGGAVKTREDNQDNVVSSTPGSTPKTGAEGVKLPPAVKGKVQLMDGERIVFTEESDPQVYLKLVASGEVNELLLEALDDYVRRQRKRLQAQTIKERFSGLADPLAPQAANR